MFWGSVSIIFMFTWDNDHPYPYHPSAASCMAMEGRELPEYPTQGLEHDQHPWLSRSLCVKHLDSLVSSALISPVPAGGLALCFRNLIYHSCRKQCLWILSFSQQGHRSVIQQTLGRYPPVGNERLLAEGAVLQRTPCSRCIGQNSNSIRVFHFAHYDTIIF